MEAPIPLDLTSFNATTAFIGSVALYSSVFLGGRALLQSKGLAPTTIVSDNEKATRRISWLITLAASGLMTLGSLPYVAQFVGSGFDVGKVQRHAVYSDALTASFIAYLATDCAAGAIFYRKQMNILTGWVHHIAYITLCSYLIRREWSQIFCLSVLLELPTFHLALSYVAPVFRHDILFTTLFFLTRIVFHIVLIVSYATPYGSIFGTAASSSPVTTRQPAIFLSLALPLHAWWFTNSVRGLLRRSKAAKTSRPTFATQPSTPAVISQTTEDERTIGLWIARRLPVDANGPIMQRISVRLRQARRTLPERMRRLQREFDWARREFQATGRMPPIGRRAGYVDGPSRPGTPTQRIRSDLPSRPGTPTLRTRADLPSRPGTPTLRARPAPIAAC